MKILRLMNLQPSAHLVAQFWRIPLPCYIKLLVIPKAHLTLIRCIAYVQHPANIGPGVFINRVYSIDSQSMSVS